MRPWAGSWMKTAEPQSLQNVFVRPPSGVHPRRRSSPCRIRTEPGVTTALADAALPVRRWQRVQWQETARTGGSVSSKRTAPQPQPPVRGVPDMGRNLVAEPHGREHVARVRGDPAHPAAREHDRVADVAGRPVLDLRVEPAIRLGAGELLL